jgi:hypothetical protein
MLKVGDLVYAPSEVRLLKFYDEEYTDYPHIYSETPTKVYRLKTPTNLLLTETKTAYKKYLKVLYDGDEWYVDENDINTI